MPKWIFQKISGDQQGERIPREFRIHRTFEFLKNLGGLASAFKIKLKICCNILFLLYSCVQLSS